MDEVVYLNEKGVTITSTKMVILGKTFATRNVGSVLTKDKGRPKWPWLLVLAGLPQFPAHNTEVGIGLVLIGLAVWWFNFPTRSLVLVAGGGEVQAITSKDIPFVQRVHDAVVNAISAR